MIQRGPVAVAAVAVTGCDHGAGHKVSEWMGGGVNGIASHRVEHHRSPASASNASTLPP
jgi:hypothetical protein